MFLYGVSRVLYRGCDICGSVGVNCGFKIYLSLVCLCLYRICDFLWSISLTDFFLVCISFILIRSFFFGNSAIQFGLITNYRLILSVSLIGIRPSYLSLIFEFFQNLLICTLLGGVAFWQDWVFCALKR